jgi:hypothetical protein
VPDAEPGAERASPYVARILQQHLVDDPASRCWTSDGTAAVVDISGFTNLSESLARKGREGAEQITELIGHIFELMLSVAYESGGSLIKFGGDSLLLWFEGDGHAARACRAMVLMREMLRDVGPVELPDAKITLKMSPPGAAWSRLSAGRAPTRSSSAPRPPRRFPKSAWATPKNWACSFRKSLRATPRRCP